jgi:hypothetical protein
VPGICDISSKAEHRLAKAVTPGRYRYVARECSSMAEFLSNGFESRHLHNGKAYDTMVMCQITKMPGLSALAFGLKNYLAVAVLDAEQPKTWSLIT